MPLLLISYDIPNDRRRNKVAKVLLKLGPRIQFSVFLLEDRAMEDVMSAIEPLLNLKEDNVRFHPLCANCMGKAILLGKARKDQAPRQYSIF